MQIEGRKWMRDISNARQIAADFYDYDFENDSLFFNRKGVDLELYTHNMQIEGRKWMRDISNARQIAADFYDYDFENDSLFFNRKGVQLESSIDLGNVILDIGAV